jgi:hypothetical protein
VLHQVNAKLSDGAIMLISSSGYQALQSYYRVCVSAQRRVEFLIAYRRDLNPGLHEFRHERFLDRTGVWRWAWVHQLARLYAKIRQT